jgi:hypothetical protein
MIYLDLEGVLIDDWHTGDATDHLAKIKSWLSGQTEVGIFSFAIDGATDVARFNQVMRPWIESTLGVRVVDVPTLTDISKVLGRTRCIVLTLDDTRQLYGKGIAFAEWVFATQSHGTFTLLDDNVKNRETRQGSVVAVTVDILSIL